MLTPEFPDTNINREDDTHAVPNSLVVSETVYLLVSKWELGLGECVHG